MSNAKTPTDHIPCPNCGSMASGKFCAECGAALLGVKCASCSTLLTPGARFCHRCGTPVGGGTPRAPIGSGGQRSVVPWVFAGAALLALVIMVAAQQGRTSVPEGTTINPSAPFAGGGGGGGRAPDISSMTPRERADRLFDRVMNMSAQGKADSASFFASMAVGAYEALAPLDLDLRYDYGRMAEMAGNLVLAKAQADTILAQHPDHLLGLILASRVAQAKNDDATAKRLLARVASAAPTELAKSVEEYVRHRNDIDAAVALARK